MINIDFNSLIRKKMIRIILSKTTTLRESDSGKSKKKKKLIHLPYLPRLTSYISEVLKAFNMRPA